jgi:hypothetical protein
LKAINWLQNNNFHTNGLVTLNQMIFEKKTKPSI